MNKRTIILIIFVGISFACGNTNTDSEKVEPTKMMKDSITAQDEIDNLKKKRDTVAIDSLLNNLDTIQ